MPHTLFYTSLGGITSHSIIEQGTSLFPDSIRSIFERFSSHKNISPEYGIAKGEYTIDASEFPELPFTIAISDNGYSIRRMGEPLKEDIGKRVFIVDTNELEEMYQKSSIFPDHIYEELKKLDIGGRMLCGSSDTIHIPPDTTTRWTIIVKRIDHPHKNHWKTPDLLRLDVDPTCPIDHEGTAISITQRVVETESGFIRGTPMNLSNLTRDCDLHFAEPWASYASKADHIAFQEHMERQKATEEQRDAALDDFDRVNQLRRSNTNTLVLEHLRDHQGSIPAPQVEGYIRQDKKDGSLFLRIERTEGLYDKIMELPEENTERMRMVEGLPRGMTLESLSNDSFGVNGIEINGTMHLFSGNNALEVPLLPPYTDRATVVLYFAAHTENRRKAMTLDVVRVKGVVSATFREGIEEGEQVGFGTTESRVLFSFGLAQKKLADAKLLSTLSSSQKPHHEQTADEKLLKEEKAYMRATPLAYTVALPVVKRTKLQR